MRRSRKATFVAISLAVAVFTSMIVSGCTQTVEQTEPDATVPTKPHGEMPEMPTDTSPPGPFDGGPGPRGPEDGPPPS